MRENFVVDDDVSTKDVDKLIKILNEYRDCFAFDMSEIGKTDLAEMKIELTADTSIYYRPYRLSFSERQKVKDLIDDLKNNKIIQESNSPYMSPILLVRKKNGEIITCVDYRSLNAITKKDSHPLPIIEDQISSLADKTKFVSLDLFSGYYQVPVSEN